MSERLVRLASEIDVAPTLEQIDAVLAELSKMDRSDEDTQRIENGLLDMRSLLVNLAQAEEQAHVG